MAFAEVSGTVTRTFFNGKGAEVIETFTKKDGSEGKSRYSLWFAAEHGLSEGDSGKWRGSLSVAVDQWEKDGETRHTAKVSINGAKPLGDRAASTTGTASVGAPARQNAPGDEPWAAAPPAPTVGGADVWNTPGNFSDDTPF